MDAPHAKGDSGGAAQKGTRARILDVAARLFMERGYAGTSVRDIAAELGIANPSLYHHFRSKEAILDELLSEPLERVEAAIDEAERLSGDDRLRRILEGLLEALEVHGGVATTAFRNAERLPESPRTLARSAHPRVAALLARDAAEDDRDLRITMAVAAVEGAVLDLMTTSSDGAAFVGTLRERRASIVALALRLLR